MDAVAIGRAAAAAGISTGGRACLLYLAADPSLSVPALALLVGAGERCIYKYLRELSRAGLLPERSKVIRQPFGYAPAFTEVPVRSIECTGVQSSAQAFAELNRCSIECTPVQFFEQVCNSAHPEAPNSTVPSPPTPPPTPAHEAAACTVVREQEAAPQATEGGKPAAAAGDGLDYGQGWFYCYSREPQPSQVAALASTVRRAFETGVTVTQADLLAAAEAARREWKDGDRRGIPHGSGWYENALAAVIDAKRDAAPEVLPKREPKQPDHMAVLGWSNRLEMGWRAEDLEAVAGVERDARRELAYLGWGGEALEKRWAGIVREARRKFEQLRDWAAADAAAKAAKAVRSQGLSRVSAGTVA